jgi:hypothetical protein
MLLAPDRNVGRGCPALNASASSNPGIAGSVLVSWSRSTGQNIAGSRIVQLRRKRDCFVKDAVAG